MGTIQENTKWEDKTQVKKGSIGERIVEEYLIKEGFVVYKPITDKAHGFDRLASRDKSHLIIVEVKSKARRNHYPDTGININQYQKYCETERRHRIPVFLFFVDEMIGTVYGNRLSALSTWGTIEVDGKEILYPIPDKGIIYFPLSKMITIGSLKDEEITQLKKYSTRSHEYGLV